MVRHTEADDEGTDAEDPDIWSTANAADRRIIGDVNLADLPDELEDDDAVEFFSFVDVPGTTLTIQFDEDADAFDVSRVVSTVDKHGYDTDSLSTVGDDEAVIGRFDRD